MNTEIIKVENNVELGITVNVYGTFEEPLFNAGEVALALWKPNWKNEVGVGKPRPRMNELRKALSIKGGQMIDTLMKDDLITYRQFTKAILKSQSPVADPFYDWIVDVVEEIRITGGYKSTVMTEEQEKHFDENNLIYKINKGEIKKPSSKINNIIAKLNDVEIIETFRYIYKGIKSERRKMFLESFQRTILKIQSNYRDDKTIVFSATVYQGYDSVLLDIVKEMKNFDNRSDGQIKRDLYDELEEQDSTILKLKKKCVRKDEIIEIKTKRLKELAF